MIDLLFQLIANNKVPYAYDMNFHHGIPSHMQFELLSEGDKSIHLRNSHVGDILISKGALIHHHDSYKTWTA